MLLTKEELQPFYIVEVDEERVKIRLQSGNERSYKREYIENGCCRWLKGGELTRQSFYEARITGKSTGGFSYPPAIIRAILNINSSSSPATP